MANNVFANGREISCKKADGKSICCFPDVCFTPPDKVPPTPPGVPIPYPNTGMAKDTTSGSKKVKISDQEILLKNKSYFKTSVGNEAGCAQKKGIITSKTKGKVYFTAWSMDVKVEGENVVRHLDLTTHNHGSATNTAPWPHLDSMAMAKGGACDAERKKENEKCKDLQVMQKKDKTKLNRSATEKAMCANTPAAKECQKARQCMLVSYKPDKEEKQEIGCCPGKTPHHVIPKSSFAESDGSPLVGWKKYVADDAPCVCCDGHSYYDGTHGDLHSRYGVTVMHKKDAEGNISRSDATNAGAKSVQKTFPESNCRQKCIKAQLDHFHDKARTATPDKKLRATHPMAADESLRNSARADMGVPLPSGPLV